MNPEVSVKRVEGGAFHVINLLTSRIEGVHFLSADCTYCHRTISIRVLESDKYEAAVLERVWMNPGINSWPGSHNLPKYAKDEAIRLALLEHLRCDHRFNK